MQARRVQVLSVSSRPVHQAGYHFEYDNLLYNICRNSTQNLTVIRVTIYEYALNPLSVNGFKSAM